jgi:hypothetical protein
MQKVAHAQVTPNFACGVPKPPIPDGLPLGSTLTSGPSMNVNDSTGVFSGTPLNVGSTKFTVQVEDSLGHTAQKTLTLVVQ